MENIWKIKPFSIIMKRKDKILPCSAGKEEDPAEVIEKLEIDTVYAGEEEMTGITVDAIIENIEKVTDFVNEELEKTGCPLKTQMQIDVALDEILSNIAHYAYEEEKGQMRVELIELQEEKGIRMIFSDTGMPFDPLTSKEPDTTSGIKDRPVGGLGIFLVRKTMDEVSYEYKDGKNVLTVIKKW